MRLPWRTHDPIACVQQQYVQVLLVAVHQKRLKDGGGICRRSNLLAVTFWSEQTPTDFERGFQPYCHYQANSLHRNEIGHTGTCDIVKRPEFRQQLVGDLE